MSRTLAIVVVAAFLLGTATAPARGGSVTAALVLGSNHALDPDLDPLHYADDDALRTAALLGLVAGDVRVLVRPDAETLALHPEISWTAPRRAAVLAALGDLVKEAEAAAAAGDDVLLYVTYSGHGSYDAEGRGYLHLEDGRLTLRDLFHHLIEPTAGVARVILLIDACNAGFLVSARGEAKRRPAGPSTLLMEDYGHVGLVLASSSAGEVREWGRYLAGIFSHQVRSGLLGGADSDGDGRVGFGELAAFVAAANAAVTNPQYRLTPYIRPPLDDPELPVMDFRGAAGHTRVRVDLPGVRRVVVTDDNLVRIADLHLEEGFEPLLHLPSAGTWWFQAGDRELRVDAGEDREVRLSGREASPRADLSSKGVDSYLRRHLFEVPFGRVFSDDYVDRAWGESLVFTRRTPRPWYRNPWGWGALSAGLVSTAMATAFHLEARQAADAAREAVYADDARRFNREVDRHNLTAGILWGVGGASTAAGILVFVLDRRWDEHRVVPELGTPKTTVVPGPGGVLLERWF